MTFSPTTKEAIMTPRTPATDRTNHPQRRLPGEAQHAARRWVTFLIPLLVLGGLVAFTVFTDRGDGAGGADDGLATAPDFDLPDTVGGSMSLDEALADGPALVYFSMGVGCDGCFAQIPEITDELDARGITLVPIMVNPAEDVAAEAARFGVEEPILIDEDRSTSVAYEMLGVYGHSDRPSHSFALVGVDGTIQDVEHYATMFVPASQLVADLNV